ncbi:hypothetical protein CJU90_5116 [Yarrowia sp. C11]|nr:hypothetical protein CJU90_5116 [Yarrowia sp. C11]
MISNDCKEKTEMKMHLDYPTAWVSRMILSIYKQREPVLTFDEATGLLILAEIYLLPDSSREAIYNIKQLVNDETSFEDLLLGWKRAREAHNDEMKQFFAQQIASKNPMSQPELFDGWDRDMLLDLYFNTLAVNGKY